MAEHTNSPEQAEGAPGNKRQMPFVLAIAAGLLVGGLGGTLLAPPLLARRSAASGAASGSEAGAASHGKEGEKGSAGAKLMHAVDNVVLNPARSGGTRFLVLSAAFEVKDQAVADEMKARDAEVRDIVLRVVGQKTVDELSDPTMREPLKSELSAAIDGLLGKSAVRHLYFPQFVIQ